MNNEPVGYFLYNEEYKEWEETHAGTPNSVPLYTHPVKELTDEEIDYEFDEFVWTGSRRADFELIVRQVERAILRKAQEKC